MFLLIRFSDDRLAQATLLAADSESVRVAVQGCEDVSTFTIHGGVWMEENGQPVVAEAMLNLQVGEAGEAQSPLPLAMSMTAHTATGAL